MVGVGAVTISVDRVVAVLGVRPDGRVNWGSGFLLPDGRVLTAHHCCVDSEFAVRLEVARASDGKRADVTGVVSSPRLDVAVLTLDLAADWAANAGPVRYGAVRRDVSGELADCQAIGFPLFQRDPADRQRNTAELHGTIRQTDERESGFLLLRDADLRDVRLPAGEPGSVWGGLSGALVFYRDTALGVVVQHHPRQGGSAIRIMPIHQIAASPYGRDIAAVLRLPDPADFPVVAAEQHRPADLDRTAYRAMLVDIAPDSLSGRDEELAELARFASGDDLFAWWQAGPWEGKSALLSWFALHPPPGVEVVAFFVMARIPGQSDSDAYAAAVIQQLAPLAGEPAEFGLTSTDRAQHARRLLEAAAARCVADGRRLLLVVDGLDEDTSTRHRPSIAALLPRNPPPGVRVVIASRPRHLTGLASDHPLLRVRPRELAPWPHARDTERLAKEQLVQVLNTNPLSRDILGLITAAGGGLRLADIETLTGKAPYRLEGIIDGQLGRCVVSRDTVDGQIYLFAHDTLQQISVQQYGRELLGYREKIHEWANTYRQRGWPADTPRYLLTDYGQLLASIGDWRRLVECGLDDARHGRMRMLTGGDGLAVTDIQLCQQALVDRSLLDLRVLAALAVELDSLVTRNNEIPAELPAVWARLGDVVRAEGLAGGKPAWRTRLNLVAVAPDNATLQRLTGQALAEVDSWEHPTAEAANLIELADVLIPRDPPRALRILADAHSRLEHVEDTGHRESLLPRLAASTCRAGDRDRAIAIARGASIPWERAEALAAVVQAMPEAYRDLGARLAKEAEEALAQIADASRRSWPLDRLIDALSAAGDHDRADSFLGQFTIEHQAEMTGRLAAATATTDPVRSRQLIARAQDLATKVRTLDAQVTTLTDVVKAIAIGGDREAAARLANRVEQYVGAPGAAHWPTAETSPFVELAEAVAAGGDFGLAERFVRGIPDGDDRMESFAKLAMAAATAGETDRAARLATEVEQTRGHELDPEKQLAVLLTLAATLFLAGDSRFRSVLDMAEATQKHFTGSRDARRTLEQLLRTANTCADFPRTVKLAGELHKLILDNDHFGAAMDGLTGLAELLAVAGATGRAGTIMTEAANRADDLTLPLEKAERRAALARVVATTGGDQALANRLIAESTTELEQVGYPDDHEDNLVKLIDAFAARSDYDTAAELTARIPHVARRLQKLANLAKAAATHRHYSRAAQLITNALAATQNSQSAPDLTVTARVSSMSTLVEARLVAGEHDRAIKLAADTTSVARQIADPAERTAAFARLATAFVRGGDPIQASRQLRDAVTAANQVSGSARGFLLMQVADDYDRNDVMMNYPGTVASLAAAYAACGDLDNAEATAVRIADAGTRIAAFSDLIPVAVAGGDTVRATRLTDMAERLIGQISHPEYRVRDLVGFAAMLISAGAHDRATQVIATLDQFFDQARYPDGRLTAYTTLIEAAGDHPHVRRLTGKLFQILPQITDLPEFHVPAMAQVAKALFAAGDRGSATRLVAEASTQVGRIEDAPRRAGALIDIADAAAAGGDHARAAELINQARVLLAQPAQEESRVRALMELSAAVAAIGDYAAAQTIVERIVPPYERMYAATQLAATAAAAGDHAFARGVAADLEASLHGIADPGVRADILTRLLPAVAVGDPAWARRLAADAQTQLRRIVEPHVRSAAIDRLASLLAAAVRAQRQAGQSDPALLDHASHAVADVLVDGRWPDSAVPLAHVNPAAAQELASRVLAKISTGAYRADQGGSQ